MPTNLIDGILSGTWQLLIAVIAAQDGHQVMQNLQQYAIAPSETLSCLEIRL